MRLFSKRPCAKEMFGLLSPVLHQPVNQLRAAVELGRIIQVRQIERNLPHFDMLVVAPEMLVRLGQKGIDLR